MSHETIASIAAAVALLTLARLLVRKVVVREQTTALLYRNGRFARALGPGAHWLWRSGREVVHFDQREQLAGLSGQEVLTRDGVPVKLSLVARYKLVAPEVAARTAASYTDALHLSLQLALRQAVSELELEELMAERARAGRRAGELARAEVERLGAELLAADVRDVILSGELKRAFAETVRLRKEGQAALERVRAETAALRGLANAAGLVRDNPALLSLRLLESIAEAGKGHGNKLVVKLPREMSAAGKEGGA